MIDATRRFSNRVADYVKARPGYPDAVVDLIKRVGVHPPVPIADIGSGTGISTALLLKHGYEVYAVEPNVEMRAAAELAHGGNFLFHSVDGRAEATTLPGNSVAAVTVAQAFHWFEPRSTRAELLRILQPDGWVFLMWNSRRTSAGGFMQKYEELLQEYAIDYNQVSHKRISKSILRQFFGHSKFSESVLRNDQIYNFDRVRSGLKSASYTPDEGYPCYGSMMEKLRNIFESHQRGGVVTYELDTHVYYGRLAVRKPKTRSAGAGK